MCRIIDVKSIFSEILRNLLEMGIKRALRLGEI